MSNTDERQRSDVIGRQMQEALVMATGSYDEALRPFAERLARAEADAEECSTYKRFAITWQERAETRLERAEKAEADAMQLRTDQPLWKIDCLAGKLTKFDQVVGYISQLESRLRSMRECAESEPKAIELVQQLRDALGLDNVARPESPQVVWEETLGEVRKLVAELERFGIGVRYHERIEERTHPLLSKRIDRLELEARYRWDMGRDGCQNCGGFRGNPTPHNIKRCICPLGEIAREVAQR